MVAYSTISFTNHSLFRTLLEWKSVSLKNNERKKGSGKVNLPHNWSRLCPSPFLICSGGEAEAHGQWLTAKFRGKLVWLVQAFVFVTVMSSWDWKKGGKKIDHRFLTLHQNTGSNSNYAFSDTFVVHLNFQTNTWMTEDSMIGCFQVPKMYGSAKKPLWETNQKRRSTNIIPQSVVLGLGPQTNKYLANNSQFFLRSSSPTCLWILLPLLNINLCQFLFHMVTSRNERNKKHKPQRCQCRLVVVLAWFSTKIRACVARRAHIPMP